MNREVFIRRRRADWKSFDLLTDRLRNRRTADWSSDDVAQMARLYRSICYDLSLVQSREWGYRLEQYLNDLVGRGHNCLYRSPPTSLGAILRFLSHGFPALLRHRRYSFLAALLLFAGPFLISMIVGWMNPDVAEQVVGSEMLRGMDKMYSDKRPDALSAEMAGGMFMMGGFYIVNNVGIAFRAFAMGVFVGIGTIKELVFNGIVLGMVFGYVLSVGGQMRENFLTFVVGHGAFELTAIVIAGCAGLVLGQGILFPGKRERMASLIHHGLQSLQLAIGAGVMLVVAAAVEGFWSPFPTHPLVKYIVGAFLWLSVILYLTLAGRDVVIHED
ncbi:MAG: stage II sporulation protein M [Planctomycetaceae bacterium]|nr:stage II sporulation protein M [Planctomycetaceae bacterium]